MEKCGCRVEERMFPSEWGGRPPPECVACRQTGRIRSRHHFLSIKRGGPSHSFGDPASGAPARKGYFAPPDPEEVAAEAFLAEAAGGWSVRTQTSAVTGRKPGRPQVGIKDHDAILDLLDQEIADFDLVNVRACFGRRSAEARAVQADVQRALVAIVPRVNEAELAHILGVHRSTVWRYYKAGLAEMQQNASKGGGGEPGVVPSIPLPRTPEAAPLVWLRRTA
jgi:hypothetical protein